jgi:hypothetical protein
VRPSSSSSARPRSGSGPPSNWRLSARERDGDGADREVALGQIGLDRLAPQRRQVDLPGAVAGDGAPGRELGGELERVAATLAGDRLRGHGGIAGDGKVEVDHLAAQRRIANGAAGDPNPLLGGQGAPGQRDRRSGGEAIGEAHAAARGTLAEIPQVTS